MYGKIFTLNFLAFRSSTCFKTVRQVKNWSKITTSFSFSGEMLVSARSDVHLSSVRFSSWRGPHWQLAFRLQPSTFRTILRCSRSEIDELTVFRASRCLTRTFITRRSTTTTTLSTGMLCYRRACSVKSPQLTLCQRKNGAELEYSRVEGGSTT